MAMDDENSIRKIDTLNERSDEVNEILGKAPHWVIRLGISIVFIIVALLILGSSLVSYNDVITVPIVITSKSQPIDIKSTGVGRLSRILIKPGQIVKAGEILAIFESPTNFEDAIKLSKRIEKYKIEIGNLDSLYSIFPYHLDLGHLQFAYGDFVSKYESYIISTQDYSSQKGEMVIEEQKILSQQLYRAFQNLKTELKLWENQFLVTTPISGKASFIDAANQFKDMPKGTTLFSITPKDPGDVLGKASLPIYDSAKVIIGQRVLVKLLSHPFEEWGSLEGRLTAISYARKGNGEPFYDLEVEISVLTTSSGRQIHFEHEMQGSAEIITEELTILQRIFYELRKLFD
ncbi:MAG: HlyD family efflux transporter periplasmic adaptor subunit [Allomuricauda sp.]